MAFFRSLSSQTMAVEGAVAADFESFSEAKETTAAVEALGTGTVTALRHGLTCAPIVASFSLRVVCAAHSCDATTIRYGERSVFSASYRLFRSVW